MPRTPKNAPDDDRRILLLDREVAEELLDLVDDTPGQADEDLLDQALDAMFQANGSLTADAQQAIAAGKAVALEIDEKDAEAVSELICTDEERQPKRIRRFGRALHSKLSAARKKRRRR